MSRDPNAPREPESPPPETPREGGTAREADLPNVCRLLRTKTSFGAGAEGALWKLGRSTTASYWCLSTMEAFGPDDSYCHPHVCAEKRVCYQPGED